MSTNFKSEVFAASLTCHTGVAHVPRSAGDDVDLVVNALEAVHGVSSSLGVVAEVRPVEQAREHGERLGSSVPLLHATY